MVDLQFYSLELQIYTMVYLTLSEILLLTFTQKLIMKCRVKILNPL